MIDPVLKHDGHLRQLLDAGSKMQLLQECDHSIDVILAASWYFNWLLTSTPYWLHFFLFYEHLISSYMISEETLWVFIEYGGHVFFDILYCLLVQFLEEFF